MLRKEGETVANDGYLPLVLAMVRTGILTYGGGSAIIPLMRHEAVNRYAWVTDDEYGEIVAVANALPGPIATKLAAYLGYRLKGWPGAVVGVVANILPTCVAMLLLFGVLSAIRESRVAQGMIAAVNPVIAVMMGVMAYEFGEKAWKGLGRWFAIAFGALAFVLLMVLDVSPALVVLLYIVYGAFHLRLVHRVQRAKRRDRGAST
ncbi:chromate transporter [Alicyclobacillus macrosporangiidus]|uniref:chromate transporter n=1 Tax=Alicyclobacillus macrosporangiidus TaxID=392015 RepID=UPI000945C4C4|nr:chromate transporter [Alicyclobacillus macrosporangiidus]